MKIEVITLFGVWNYGSVLQALATQSFFEELGHEVEFINYRRRPYHSVGGFIHDVCKDDSGLKSLLKPIVYLPSVLRWQVVFGEFCKKFLHISKQVFTTPDDLHRNVPKADIYCTGSDQVWNSTLNGGVLPQFFLDFAPAGSRCISFSASFGKDELDEWEIEETRRLLSRYDYITCRESSGVDICHGLGMDRVHQVLDPTLLLHRDYWQRFVGNRPVKQKYLLVYQLHKEEGMDVYIRELSRRRGLKIVRVCYRYDECRKLGYPMLIPSVVELLTAICHADLVVTDSFHGTAFSTNFQKDFISIVPAHQFGGRINSLLSLTGLQRRAVSRFDDFSPMDNVIDWKQVDEVYDRERRETGEFFAGLLGSVNA